MNLLFTELQEAVIGKTAEEIVKAVYNIVAQNRVVLASSIAAEDQILTREVSACVNSPRIFTLDTGRVFQEVYDTMEKTRAKYGISYEVFVPDANELQELLNSDGPNSFYRSIELRKRCCAIRKTNPLKKALSTVDVWICGLRREQSVTRTAVEAVEWDEVHGIVKVNPLYNWSEDEVWKHIHLHTIPYCILHDHGYRSIGCQPCTRAIDAHDDIRAGRWWWESAEHRECGLHSRQLK